MDYIEIEKTFNVVYPDNRNATYSSILNFSDDLKKPIQRWFRYKEGYSIELIELRELVNDLGLSNDKTNPKDKNKDIER